MKGTQHNIATTFYFDQTAMPVSYLPQFCGSVRLQHRALQLGQVRHNIAQYSQFGFDYNAEQQHCGDIEAWLDYNIGQQYYDNHAQCCGNHAVI